MSTACSAQPRQRRPHSYDPDPPPQPRVFRPPAWRVGHGVPCGLPPVAGGLTGTKFRFLVLINGF
jgi:hypothetical protein